MTVDRDIDFFLNTIINEELYSTKSNLQFHLDTIFKGIDFRNKTVLDIGGGSGLLSFYASYKGAKEVLCLEPEADGASSHAIEKFQKVNRILEFNNVKLEPITFQAYEPVGNSYDIIVLYNSINHLDETACINLLKDDTSKVIYKNLFLKLHSLLNTGGKVIICDCSKYNFFNLFKLRNPFAPTIEWHKHQSPEVWAKLLGDVGFANHKIRWSSFNSLRNWGRFLIGNKLMAYFLNSHFCLTVDKL